jgi:hypothetical protein
MTTHDMQPEASGAGRSVDRYPADSTEAQEQRGFGQQQPGFDQQQPGLEQQGGFEEQRPGFEQQRGFGEQRGAAADGLENRPDTGGVGTPGRIGESSGSAGADGQALFSDSDHSDLRARWNEVQAAFVDDPRECVQKADGLVTDLVEKVTAGFGQARSRLEEQWARGEEVSTEDLRVALRRYRDFFERLLSV